MPTIIATLLTLIFLSPEAFGWGREGHQTVALIAEARLNQQAREEVKSLLNLEGHSTLSEVASWADEIRGTSLDTISHAVRIPFDDEDFVESRDCAKKIKCVIYGIQYSESVLTNDSSSPTEKLQALKFLVHFVGDIHQPLHAISETGQMKVSIVDKTYTLHKVWDTIALRSYNITPKQLAKNLLSNPVLVEQKTEIEWALESHAIAKSYIYHNDKSLANGQAQFELPQDYLQSIKPMILQQLYYAGVRLSNILNTLLKNNNYKETPP